MPDIFAADDFAVYHYATLMSMPDFSYYAMLVLSAICYATERPHVACYRHDDIIATPLLRLRAYVVAYHLLFTSAAPGYFVIYYA